MLQTATSDSLVLMDELGRATDPEEGGALGVTILEAFRHRGAYTVGLDASHGDESLRSLHSRRAQRLHGIRR